MELHQQYTTPPTFNTNTTLSSTTFPYSSQSYFLIIKYLLHQFTNISNIVQLNSSPMKSSNNDVTVHYIGGFVIRESNHPFISNENLNQKENNEQIRCIICQKIDFSQRFFDQEKKFCSKLCSLKSTENKIPIL